MKTEDKIVEIVTDETTNEMEQDAQLTLEDAIRKLFVNKEIAKERNEENKMLMELIEEKFEELNGNELIIELPSGEYAKVFKKPRIKEVLDREGLANHLQIAKDELKTPWDFSKLAEKFLEEAENNKDEETKEEKQKKMSRLIVEFTETETLMQTKVSKLKRKPKKKKSDEN